MLWQIYFSQQFNPGTAAFFPFHFNTRMLNYLVRVTNFRHPGTLIFIFLKKYWRYIQDTWVKIVADIIIYWNI